MPNMLDPICSQVCHSPLDDANINLFDVYGKWRHLLEAVERPLCETCVPAPRPSQLTIECSAHLQMVHIYMSLQLSNVFQLD